MIKEFDITPDEARAIVEAVASAQEWANLRLSYAIRSNDPTAFGATVQQIANLESVLTTFADHGYASPSRVDA